jgi:hypothetical protein
MCVRIAYSLSQKKKIHCYNYSTEMFPLNGKHVPKRLRDPVKGQKRPIGRSILVSFDRQIKPDFVRYSTRGMLSMKQSDLGKRQQNVRDRTFCYHCDSTSPLKTF